jgi:hypothetical protein
LGGEFVEVQHRGPGEFIDAAGVVFWGAEHRGNGVGDIGGGDR